MSYLNSVSSIPTVDQVVAGCEKLLQKVESCTLYSCNKIPTCFTDPRQTCFVTSDALMSGVTPA